MYEDKLSKIGISNIVEKKKVIGDSDEMFVNPRYPSRFQFRVEKSNEILASRKKKEKKKKKNNHHKKKTQISISDNLEI